MNQETGDPVDAWQAIARAAADRTGVAVRYLDGYVALLDETSRTGRRIRREELDALRGIGEAAARDGVPLPSLTHLYMTAAECAWPALPAVANAPTAAGVRTAGASVLTVVNRVLAALTEGHALTQRQALDREEAIRQEFIDDLLRGRGDPGSLAARADRFGVLLASPHIVTVARSSQGFTVADGVPRHIESSLAARFGLRNVLVAVRDSQLVCIVPRALRGSTGEFFHHLVGAVGKDVRWQVGVGRPHAGSGGVLKSYNEARGALDLAERLGFRAPVLHAADLLVFPVLLRDHEAITDLVDSVLGPLTDARGGPVPLLETLTAHFDCQGNTSATARKLGITARAVMYRLDRVHSLTGYSPAEPTQRFTLEAAVLGARLLGWPQELSSAG
ncbi:PucR family transcriptional regulator [Streptomyces sp. NBC_00280]|uniref:PucR family transcriptional regulator n=1 Tax=Streptomyces sp. NBC_00280 TaxID=2975699 RepID=UPI003250BE89